MRGKPAPVITIDCQYLQPEHAAAYLVIEQGRAAFVDNNTVHAVPLLLAALEENGLNPADVAYIIPTHLHLDHGGGTSLLVKECANATVLAHPRAVRHFIEPSRLIAGVKAVYGEAEYEAMYAPIVPIDAARIRAVADNETLEFGARALTFMHTRGHANHHICIHDSKSNGVFTGDSFGVEYNSGRVTKRPFLMCSSAPTDFDPDAARDSIRRIVGTGAERVFVAHYGELTDVRGGAEVMLESIDRMERVLKDATDSALDGDALQQFCEEGVRKAFEEQIAACGVVLEETAWQTISTGARIDAQGIAYLAKRLRT